MPDYLSQLLPEEKLLLCLCRLSFSDQQKAEICDLVKQITNWPRFVTLANEHGIIALCRHNLVTLHCDATIPEKYREILHAGYLKSLSRNTKMFELLKEVLSIAASENIKVVLLKGLALEKTIYGNSGLRQMNDLDILVRIEDAIKLRNLLLKNSFKSQPAISPLHEKILPSYGKHLPEMYKNGLSVEIHFKLFEQKGNSLTEQFIENSMSLYEFPDSKTFHPEPETRNPEPQTFPSLVHYITSSTL